MNALRIPLVFLAAVSLALCGCSTSDPDAAGTPAPPTPSGWGYGPSTAPIESPPAPGAFVGASVRADQTWPEPVTDIDLVKLRFTGGPGCEARYVDPPITDEVSGQPVEIEGAAFLQVTCQPVTSLGPDTDRYSSPDTKNVTEVVKTGYNGSALNWTIGLERRAPFGVAFESGDGSVSGVLVGIVQ